MGSSGSFVFASVNFGTPRDRWVHSASHGFTGEGKGVVMLIMVRLSSLWSAKWSSGSFGFACVHLGLPTGS